MRVRINGRGNAWPVELGSVHPFYHKDDFFDLSNTSFSVMGRVPPLFEFLIDAGHGIPQFLIQNGNRIPEAVFLTHPHIDHSLGIDWIVQSYARQKGSARKYPLYATAQCFRSFIRSFPFLEKLIALKEMHYGTPLKIDECRGLSATVYPVFHGRQAPGASMILVEDGYKRFLFTGDLLCPLLRKEDYRTLADLDCVFTDCNNRFPAPRTNHWSFLPACPDQKGGERKILEEWIGKKSGIDYLISPHAVGPDHQDSGYFDALAGELADGRDIPFSIVDFLHRLGTAGVRKKPERIITALFHYSGNEDRRLYGQKILNDHELEQWAGSWAERQNIPVVFKVPRTGAILDC